MNRLSILSFFVVIGGISALLAATANSQLGAPKAYVNLQPTTPGTSQSGHSNVSGTSRASQFVGSGSGLSSLNASELATGTVPDARLSSNIPRLNSAQTFSGANTFSGGISVSSFALATGASVGRVLTSDASGNASWQDPVGGGINLQASHPGTMQTGHGNISGVMKANTFTTSTMGISSPGFFGIGSGLTALNASNISSGTLADARLSGNVDLLNTVQTYSASKSFTVAPSFNAAGSPFFVAGNTLVANLNADLLDGLSSSSFLQSIPNPLVVTGTNLVQIIRGENDHSAGTGVYGLSTAATGSNNGVRGTSESTTGRGVYGTATAASGANFGGYFQSDSTSGRGIFGRTTAGTGFNYGGEFRSDSSDGRGVFGWAAAASGDTSGGFFWSTSTSGRGVYGTATAASGITNGVWGQSSSPNGRGVFGYATEATGDNFGVYGRSDSTQGQGVFGFAQANSGTNFGVYGLSNSPDGRGVNGNATAASGFAYGVRGESASNSGFGVYGIATSAGGNTYGVRGSNTNTSGYGVYSLGDMGASGTKPFRIDHPFDPENRYLLHYAAESPMPQNFYVGNVVTDSKGYAWVELPDYFAEINVNFKYQLTVVDDADSAGFVMAKVSKKIRDGRFQIRTSSPNVEVSWEVKADRNDLYVQKKQPKDVVEKTGLERGKYQHPDLYGMPPERGMDYRPATETRIAPKRK